MAIEQLQQELAVCRKEEEATRERTAKVQTTSCLALAEAAAQTIGTQLTLTARPQSTEEQATQLRTLQQQLKRFQQELAMREDEVQAGAEDVKHVRANYQELQVRKACVVASGRGVHEQAFMDLVP